MMTKSYFAGRSTPGMVEGLPAGTPNPLGWMLVTAQAHALADHYLARRGDAAVMPRAVFDPAEIKALLPRLYMLELHSPQDIRVRLCGTCLSDRVGRELTGLNWLDLIAPEHRAARALAYGQMMQRRTALRAVLRYPSNMDDEMVLELLTLPMTPTGPDSPALAIGVVASLSRTAGARPQPFLRGTESITALPLA